MTQQPEARGRKLFELHLSEILPIIKAAARRVPQSHRLEFDDLTQIGLEAVFALYKADRVNPEGWSWKGYVKTVATKAMAYALRAERKSCPVMWDELPDLPDYNTPESRYIEHHDEGLTKVRRLDAERKRMEALRAKLHVSTRKVLDLKLGRSLEFRVMMRNKLGHARWNWMDHAEMASFSGLGSAEIRRSFKEIERARSGV